MRVTHKQLVDLVLPVLDTACEVWRNRITEAVEAGKGIELDEWIIEVVSRWAARCGHVECLKALLEAGLSQGCLSEAAWAAAVCGQVECLKLLIAAGVSQAWIDEAARWVARYGQVECQKLLEEAKAKEE